MSKISKLTGIDKAVSRIESFKRHFDCSLGFYDRRLGSYEKSVKRILSWNEKLYNQVIKFIDWSFPFARKHGAPFHRGWFNRLIADLKTEQPFNPLLTPGVHYVSGKMGAGKSSVVFHTLKEILDMTGCGSYTSTNFESAKYDPLTGKYFKYFKQIEPADFFNDYKIAKRFDTYNFKAFFVDEFGSAFNPRRNRERKQNETLLPMIQLMREKRHIKLPWIYLANQSTSTDNQVRQIVQFEHHPVADLAYDFDHWVETGELVKKFKGWFLQSYRVDSKPNDGYELTMIYDGYIDCVHSMDDFETLAEADNHAMLPVDKSHFM